MVGALPLGRVLVKTDILVLGKLMRSRDDNDDDDGIVLLHLYAMLYTVFAKYFPITVLH